MTEHDLKMAFDDGYQAGFEMALGRCAILIDELDEKIIEIDATQPKWISVSQRLPEKNGCYLVAINCPKGRWVECNSYNHLEQRWSSEWGCFREDTTELVTHWMSLLEPPELPESSQK